MQAIAHCISRYCQTSSSQIVLSSSVTDMCDGQYHTDRLIGRLLIWLNYCRGGCGAACSVTEACPGWAR